MSRRLALLLCAALALATPGLAAALDVTVCESFGKDACVEHADKCIHCTAWDRVDVCFEIEIAKRLPTKLFTCDWPAPPAPPVEPSPEPQPVAGDCQDYSTEVRGGERVCVLGGAADAVAVAPAAAAASAACELPVSLEHAARIQHACHSSLSQPHPQDACAADNCVWCRSAAVRSACYSEAEARRLPAAVFACKFPSLAQQ